MSLLNPVAISYPQLAPDPVEVMRALRVQSTDQSESDRSRVKRAVRGLQNLIPGIITRNLSGVEKGEADLERKRSKSVPKEISEDAA